MKNFFTSFLGSLFACLTLSAYLCGQPPRTLYDANTVVHVSGTVDSVETIPHSMWTGQGVHITLKTEGDDVKVPIHIGPKGYLARIGLAISKGDNISITGSLVNSDHESFIIASEIQKNGNDYYLRDEYGIPMWSGRYRNIHQN